MIMPEGKAGQHPDVFHDIADPQAQRQEHGNAADAIADCTVDEPKTQRQQNRRGHIERRCEYAGERIRDHGDSGICGDEQPEDGGR